MSLQTTGHFEPVNPMATVETGVHRRMCGAVAWRDYRTDPPPHVTSRQAASGVKRTGHRKDSGCGEQRLSLRFPTLKMEGENLEIGNSMF